MEARLEVCRFRRIRDLLDLETVADLHPFPHSNYPTTRKRLLVKRRIEIVFGPFSYRPRVLVGCSSSDFRHFGDGGLFLLRGYAHENRWYVP